MIPLKRQRNFTACNQSGYTILESIVAMVIVSALMISIAPLLAFSFATRVQAKRVELASKAANTYINAVRSGSIEPTFNSGSDAGPSASGSLSCAAGEVCSGTEVYCVDNDSTGTCTQDSLTDMVVQGLASNCFADTELKDGYKLIVRVYRADAFKESGTLLTDKLQSTQGLGNAKYPLAMVTTEIADSETSFQDYTNRLKEQEKNPQTCL